MWLLSTPLRTSCSHAAKSAATRRSTTAAVIRPGWRAEVNGVETPIYRANGALRALAVPAGVSTVELRFAPPSWRTGLWLALAGLIIAAVLSFIPRRRNPRPSP